MKLIIVNEPGHDSYGPDAMSNTLCICDCVLDGKKDGDEVEAKITGKIVEHEGKRYISVATVDGEPVEEMDSEDYQDSPMDETPKPMMDANDALDHFFGKH